MLRFTISFRKLRFIHIAVILIISVIGNGLQYELPTPNDILYRTLSSSEVYCIPLDSSEEETPEGFILRNPRAILKPQDIFEAGKNFLIGCPYEKVCAFSFIYFSIDIFKLFHFVFNLQQAISALHRLCK